MVVQPVTAPGNAPENPGIKTPNQGELHLPGQMPLNVETDQAGRLSLSVSTKLPFYQHDRMVTPQLLNFSLDAWVKALEATVSESGRQLNTSKLSTIEFSPPDGPELPVPAKVLFPTAKEFHSNIFEKLRSFRVLTVNYRIFYKYVKKKITFFFFFC